MEPPRCLRCNATVHAHEKNVALGIALSTLTKCAGLLETVCGSADVQCMRGLQQRVKEELPTISCDLIDLHNAFIHSYREQAAKRLFEPQTQSQSQSQSQTQSEKQEAATQVHVHVYVSTSTEETEDRGNVSNASSAEKEAGEKE